MALALPAAVLSCLVGALLLWRRAGAGFDLRSCGRHPCAAPPVGAPPDPGLHQALWDWAREAPLPMRVSRDIAIESEGLRTAAAMQKMDVILEVPRKWHVSLANKHVSRMVGWIPKLESELFRSGRETALAAFLASELEAQMASRGSSWLPSVWLERLNRLDMSTFPHWQREDQLDMLWPSPTYFRTLLARESYHHDFEVVNGRIPAGTLPRPLNFSFFTRAVELVNSRSFYTDGWETLVPVADSFNYAGLRQVTGIFHYHEDREMFAVYARWNLSAGEEITLDYGEHTNAHLLGQYGFTLAPVYEPFQTFDLYFQLTQDGKPALPLLSPSKLPMPLILLTRELSPVLVEFARSNPGYARLGEFLGFYLGHYGGDPRTRPYVEIWEGNREEDPNTTVWWTRFSACETKPSESREEARRRCAAEEDLSRDVGSGSAWEMHAARAKMGEYVCLVAHSQMLDIRDGRLSPEGAIAPARLLASELASKVPGGPAA